MKCRGHLQLLCIMSAPILGVLLLDAFDPLFKTFPKRHILDSSKLKEFTNDNFEFDKNGEKSAKRVENTVTSNFSFSHSVFKTLVPQTRKTQG